MTNNGMMSICNMVNKCDRISCPHSIKHEYHHAMCSSECITNSNAKCTKIRD